MLQAQRTTASWPTMLLARIVSAIPRGLRWSIAVIAIALPVFAFCYGHELKQEIKRQLSHWDVAAAQPMLEDPLHAEEGIHLLVTALIRTPEDPQVIRALAEVTERAGLAQHARFFYEHLSRIAPLTLEDQLVQARVLARLNDSTGAQLILQHLSQTTGETPALTRARADIAAEAGDHVKTRAALEKILRSAPEDKSTEMQLAQSRALSPEAQQQQRGVEDLLTLFEKSLTERDPARRNHCFWTLAGMQLTDPAQRQRLASLIGQMPWQTLERRVVQRFLQASLDPTDADRTQLRAWLRRMITEETQTHADERLHIAKIMQQHGEHNLVIEWLPFELALQETALCTTRIDSLLILRLWQQARLMIEDRATPLNRPLQAILTAQVEMLSSGGHSLPSTVLLHEALTAARDKGEQGNYIAIGRLAAEFGHHSIAVKAYSEAMAEAYPTAMFLLEPLTRAARQASMSAGGVLTTVKRRARAEAWHQSLENHITYLAVLSGEDLEKTAYQTESIPADDPAAPHHHLCRALALHRLGDHTALVEAAAKLPLQHAWTAPEKATLHGILTAAGRAADAAKLLPINEPLFEEEKRLLLR